MPRYYFHYRTDDELIRDAEGSDLPNLDAAERNAAALAKAIIERTASTGGDTTLPRSIEITDAAGEELLYLVFWSGPALDEAEEDELIEPATIH